MMASVGREVLDAYRGETVGTRALVRGRWATCPFPQVVAPLPAAGRILDWGCGHGLASLAAVVGGKDRFVEGVDVDEGKVAVAERAASAAGVADRTTFRSLAVAEGPAGSWDGIVVVDVLYLVDRSRQERLVRAAVGALAPGGVLVIKETGTQPRWKVQISRFQEQVAVRVARITRSEQGVPGVATPEELARWASEEGAEVEVHPVDRGYHVAHTLVIARRT